MNQFLTLFSMIHPFSAKKKIVKDQLLRYYQHEFLMNYILTGGRFILLFVSSLCIAISLCLPKQNSGIIVAYNSTSCPTKSTYHLP